MKLFCRIIEARCAIENAKEDLVILHGLFGISDNWIGYARKLSANRKIIIPDLRNHGQSPNSDDFDLDMLVNDLHEIIIDNKCKNTIIMGHSLGGRIAMRYALLYPNFVNKLIVIDMSMRSVRKKPEHIALINIIKDFPLEEMHSIAEIKSYLSKKTISEKLNKIIIKNLKKTESGFKWKVYSKPLIELFNKESEPIAISNEAFNDKALFIKGGNSDYILDSDFPLINKHFPNAKIISIEGASHWVHADKPIEFLSIVQEFVGI